MDADQPLLAVLMVMTVVTGMVDAASFLGLGHVFTANMTGNVVLLGFALAGMPHLSVARSLASLGAFLLGATIGGRIGVSMSARTPKRWLVATALIEAALLGAAAIAATGYDSVLEAPVGRLYSVIVLSALGMGLRTATVRRLAIPDLTTTVLTMTLTGLAADSHLAGGKSPHLNRRLTAVVALCAGAFVGARMLRVGLASVFITSCACVFLASVTYVVWSRVQVGQPIMRRLRAPRAIRRS